MKVGDRVKIISAEDDDTAISYIGFSGKIDALNYNHEYPIKVRFDRDGSFYFFKRNELEEFINSTSSSAKENFYVRCKSYAELADLINWAATKGYTFYKHAGLSLDCLSVGICDHINFSHGNNSVYGEGYDSFSLDNNPQCITLCYSLPELLSNDGVTKENMNNKNMNDDLERVIREGNMAMKLVGSVKASPTTIAYTEDITSTLGTLKKKDKSVGFVSTPLKNTI